MATGTPFTIKDIEATGTIARGLEQWVENEVTQINGKIFKKLRGEGLLSFTDEEWQRYCTSYIGDPNVRKQFNRLLIEASTHNINLNEDIVFIEAFARHFRPCYEEKKDNYAQVIQLAGMGNLTPPKKCAEDVITGFSKTELAEIYRSGRTNSITGDKGGGKSHLAVWHMDLLRDMDFIIFTNILFKKLVKINPDGTKKFIEEYPRNIIKVESLTDLLKKVALELVKNPYRRFVFFWDELQNSLSSYEWNTDLFKAIIKFFSITRKFGQDKKDINGGLAVTVMSPSFYRGIPKGIREELNNAFLKDEEFYERFMSKFPDGKQYNLKQIVFHKKGKRTILDDKQIGDIKEVGTCSICDEQHVQVGDIIYAQKGYSFLKLGRLDNGAEMDLHRFNDFLDFTSKKLPEELPQAVLEYLHGNMNNCSICGKETTNPKYCCDACKQKAYREKSNEK